MHTLNPSKICASAHRAMAIAALHADSSVSVRLCRYNAHMAKARALETAALDEKHPATAIPQRA